MSVVILVVAVAFSSRLAYLMLFKADEYRKRAIAIQERERSIKAPRGVIYDRNGVVLAENKSVATISVIHSQVKDPEQVVSYLSDKLSLDEDYVRKRVEKVSSREKIKSNVDIELAKEIRNENIAGIVVDEDYKRYYPHNELLSKVLGFTGGDNQGVLGLESKYDSILAGQSGSINTVTAANGKNIPNGSERRVESTPGNNLVLSIDINIQTYIENAAMRVLEKKQAKRVCIIVMNPQNGEIYGLADVPGYNLNEPFVLNDGSGMTTDNQDILNRMWRCFPINDTYEPGSTFKIITTTAGFECNVLNEADGFFCPGYKMVSDRRIRCHKVAGHGSETFVQGIQNSCNPVFMTVGERVGVDNFFLTMEKLGFFEKTGIDLPGEANSICHEKSNVGPVELATMSFGQSFQITPMQLLRGVSAAINGGTLVTPHFGMYITDPNNNIIEKLEYTKKTGAISEENSERVRALLESVVSEGTGHRAYIEGYRIGGKTATSEKLPRRDKKYISSFIGFAPADNPKVITLVLIDEPTGVYYGGTIAAPVAQEIYNSILPYLGIEKEIIPQ